MKSASYTSQSRKVIVGGVDIQLVTVIRKACSLLRTTFCTLMMRILLPICAAVALAAAAAPHAPGVLSQPDMQYKGITFTDDKYCNISFSTTAANHSLTQLAATGANWVSIVVTQYQETANSTKVFPVTQPIFGSYYTYITATDDSLRIAVQRSHALGLSVMLKPQVDLLNDSAHWRGNIGDGFSSQQWDAWFASYGAMLLNYAKLAQQEHVEMLAVSTELIAACLQPPKERWLQLLKKVRAVYNGRLVNAANWGGEETGLTWWDAVDMIGVDAYYPLNVPDDATVPQLVDAWQPIVAKLANLSSFWQRPVLFTEIGYCSTDCKRSAVPVTAADLTFQARRYEAVMTAFRPFQWHTGFFWWAWSTDPGSGGQQDRCITPAYKPAENVLRSFYGGSTQPVPSSPPVPPTCPCTV